MMSSIALPAGLRDQFGTEAESKDQISAWLMKNLRSVPADQRPQMGKLINELKNKVQAQYDEADRQMYRQKSQFYSMQEHDRRKR